MTDRCPIAHGDATVDSPPPPLRITRRNGLRASVDFVRDPFGLLESISGTADLVHTRILGVPTVVLAHPSVVSEMMRDTKGTWIKDRLSRRGPSANAGGTCAGAG
jgi:hypothetical protein